MNVSNVIELRMKELHLTHAALASKVGDIEGEPTSPHSAWWWVNRPDRLKPRRIRSIEQVLKLPPGSLIELLGGPSRKEVAEKAIIR